MGSHRLARRASACGHGSGGPTASGSRRAITTSAMDALSGWRRTRRSRTRRAAATTSEARSSSGTLLPGGTRTSNRSPAGMSLSLRTVGTRFSRDGLRAEGTARAHRRRTWAWRRRRPTSRRIGGTTSARVIATASPSTASAPAAVLLLGAGWSRVAGRPLTSELFDQSPFAPSEAAARSNERVMEAWRSWVASHPGQGPEPFLAEISPQHSPLQEPLWPDAIRYVGARLAEPDVVRLEHELRYGEWITKPSPALCHHALLTQLLRQYELTGVITTNFDLLAERTLRHRVMKKPPRPGFFYPGIPGPLRGPSTFSVRHRWVDVSGTVPLCKLHGSLSWAIEGGSLRAYADCRPAYRRSNISYVVPPQPEKRARHSSPRSGRPPRRSSRGRTT